MGARDVLAFGPYLIKDGQINSFSQTYGNTNQPRSGMGMVAPGHYFAAVVEGRIKGSKGTTVSALCQHLADLGCTTAQRQPGFWVLVSSFKTHPPEPGKGQPCHQGTSYKAHEDPAKIQQAAIPPTILKLFADGLVGVPRIGHRIGAHVHRVHGGKRPRQPKIEESGKGAQQDSRQP